MNRRFFIVFALLLAAGMPRVSPPLYCQEGDEVRSAVRDLETALFSSNLKALSGRLAKQVFLSLKGGEGGHYSANQAQYILQDYFAARKVASLRFSDIVEREGSPYATGSGTVRHKGSVQPLQVFVAFARPDGRWVITQLYLY